MKAIVFVEQLSKTLSLVNRIVSGKTQLPILGNVLLTVDKSSLYLTTTNLETAIKTKIPASVEQEGEITVPAKQLLEIASLIKEEKINISVENNVFKIESKRIKNKLNTMPANEFPPLAAKTSAKSLTIKKKELDQMVKQVAIAASQDESRPVLQGVRIGKTQDQIEAAATDGYRLSVKKVLFEKEMFDKPLIIPLKTLLEVDRIAQEQKEEEINLLIIKENNQIVFNLKDTEVYSRLIEGDFPEYQKIIPGSYVCRVIIDKDQLLDDIKMAAIFARESANIIRMKIEDKKLIITANAPQVGENQTVLEVEQEGENVEAAFNYRFLIDFLSTISNERIVFETGGPLSPGVFKDEKDSSLIHIVMPVRVQTS